jgi:hypothetical protein
LENISLSKYHELRKKGLGPAVTEIDGLQRITPEARDDWHALMAEHAQSEAARLEAKRRHEQAITAGKRAAESALHISKRRKRHR